MENHGKSTISTGFPRVSMVIIQAKGKWMMLEIGCFDQQNALRNLTKMNVGRTLPSSTWGRLVTAFFSGGSKCDCFMWDVYLGTSFGRPFGDYRLACVHLSRTGHIDLYNMI